MRGLCSLLVDLVWKYKISPPEVTDFNENSGYEYFLKKRCSCFLEAGQILRETIKICIKILTKTKYLIKTALPHFEVEKNLHLLWAAGI